MTDAEKETLERAAHTLDQIGLKGAHWANIHVRSGGAAREYEADYLKYLPDAIRSLLAENERLRADRDGFKDIARNQRKCIEAARALLKRNPCDCREDDCHHCELVRLTVEALKGRYDE